MDARTGFMEQMSCQIAVALIHVVIIQEDLSKNISQTKML